MCEPTNGELLKAMNSAFNNLEKRLTKIDERFDAMELRLDRIECRLDAVEKRLDVVEKRLDSVENNMVTKDYLSNKVKCLNDDMTALIKICDLKTSRLVNILVKKELITEKDSHTVLIL